MSPESGLLTKIETLRFRIEELRQEILDIERQLDDLLVVYLEHIREHERIAS